MTDQTFNAAPQPTNPAGADQPAQAPAPSPLPAESAPAPVTAPAGGSEPASGAYSGPRVGTLVGFTDYDPYADAEVTRYGLVVAEHPRDADDTGSTDRAEIAWLPEGTAVIGVDDLDEL